MIDIKKWFGGPGIGDYDEVGGQGMVYFRPSECPKYAIKRLKNNDRQVRFSVEVSCMKMLARLGINVVPILDENVTQIQAGDKFLCYVMPFYRRGSIETEVRDGSPLFGDIKKAIQAFLDLAATLDKIHKQGVFHRDIKPANILINDDDTLFFADFGLCFISDELRDTATLEQKGSRHWIAPEMLKGRIEINNAYVDYYPMGKILYFMLTGKVLAGVGPYVASDIAGINHEEGDVIRQCILGLVSFDAPMRKQYWESTLKVLRGQDNDMPSETSFQLPERSLLRLKEQVNAKRAANDLHISWKKFGDELKRIVSTEWQRAEPLCRFKTRLESEHGVNVELTSAGFGPIAWTISGRGSATKENTADNALLRIKSGWYNPYVVPVAAAGIESHGGITLDRIRLLVGVTKYDKSNAQDFFPEVAPSLFWEKESFVGDPLLLSLAKTFGQESAKAWCDVLKDLLDGGFWS